MQTSIQKDTFYNETFQCYEKGKLPNKFFEPSVRKRRIKCLLEYIVYEVENTSPAELLDRITWDFIIEKRLEKLVQFVDDPKKESKNELARSILRLAYPDLPETDLKTRTLEVYEEVLQDTKKNFPNNYFGMDIGYFRASYIYKHLYEGILKKDPQKDGYLDKEILIQYKLRFLCEKRFTSPVELHREFYK